MIHYKNNGPELVSTNFWDTEIGQKYFVVSVNAGCMRLLIPNCKMKELPEMVRNCEYALVSRLRNVRPMKIAAEILFEDHSASPYCLFMGPESFGGFFPLADEKPIERKLTIWTEGVKKYAEMPAYLRYAPRIPWMKPLRK
jgi:hypothetical protein